MHGEFLGYMNKKKSIALFNKIWSAKIRRHAEFSAKAKWKVQIGWNEDNTTRCEIPNNTGDYFLCSCGILVGYSGFLEGFRGTHHLGYSFSRESWR